MAPPVNATVVTVTGTYVDHGGSPLSGSVTFVPSIAIMRDPDLSLMIDVDETRIVLDADGHFEVELLATDDPDLIPTGWYYTVVERLGHRDPRVWYLLVAYDGPDPLDISTVPSVTVLPTVAAAVTSVVGQVGDVTGAQIVADPTVTAALDERVPYTGATADVDLGAHQVYARNLGHFEGALTDPVITDNGDQTIDVATIDVMIRADPTDPDAPRLRMTVPALVSEPITDNATNYIVVDYGGGTPYYALTLSALDLSLSRVPVARFYVEAGVVAYTLVYGAAGRSTPSRHLYREALLSEPMGARRESGLWITEAPTRVVTIASGVVWFVLARIELAALTMGGVGIVSDLVYHVAGTWTKTTITQYDNTWYDDGTDLAPLGNNKFGVNWVYRGISTDNIVILLGGGSYTLAEAIASSAPVGPQWVTEFHWLVGRIIVEKGASAATLIENNVAGTEFAGTAYPAHNDLDGLQGGVAPDEYYHLTAAEYAGIGTGYVPYTGATTDLDLGANSVHAGNLGYGEGLLDDPTIVDAAGVAIAITSVEAIFRADTDWGGTDGRVYRATVAPTASLAVADDAVNYVYADWNGGSPVYATTLDKYLINGSDLLAVSRVAMSSGVIEYQMPYGALGRGMRVRTADWIYKTSGRGGITREFGLAVSESATRVVTVSAGAAWFGIDRITLDAITNGVAGTTMHLWYHSAGMWTEATITQYDNTQYDNGTNLATLTSNRYAVNWVYRSLISNEIDIILGSGDYTLAQAEASTLPVAPQVVSAFYALAGRIIVQKGASTATAIQSVTTTTFNQAAVSNHEDLAGLQGGTTGEHYHLTAAQHAAYGMATSLSAGTPASSGAAGTAGQVLYDADYVYVCVAANTWKRVALTTF